MLRLIIPIAVALAIIFGCVFYLNYDTSINSGTDDVLYNDIVYERTLGTDNWFEIKPEYTSLLTSAIAKPQ